MLLFFFLVVANPGCKFVWIFIAIVKPSYERIAVAQVDDKKLPEGSYTPRIQPQNEDREKASARERSVKDHFYAWTFVKRKVTKHD